MTFDWVIDLPPVVSASIFVIATVLLALGSYFIARAFLHDPEDDDQRDLAASVVIRISALHGLILALVFAQELSNNRDVAAAAAREAVLVADVYFDMHRYDDPAGAPVQKALADYTRHVLAEEWESLAETDLLSAQAWASWQAAYAGILSLEPAAPHQEVLQDLMIHHIREISGLRRARENAATTGVPALFMTAAVAGVILTAAGYFTFAPRRRTITLISLFAAYTGLVIFFVVAFSDPYRGPGMVQPVGFERVYTGEVRALADSP